MQSETSDSGFISGPQSSQIFSEEIIPEAEEQQQQPEPKDQEPLKQKQQQQQSVVLDSGIIDEDEEDVEEEEPAQEDKSSNQMRLKHSTDAGIPQWTVQSNLAGRGEQLNNLGGGNSAQISASRSKGPQSITQSNTAAATATNPSSAPQSSINIMNAWEQFYQQNDVGDT